MISQKFDVVLLGHFAKGRSGRGDTCISTYIAKRLTLAPYEALCFAAALTTLKLEKEGPFRGKLEDVEVLSRKPGRGN